MFHDITQTLLAIVGVGLLAVMAVAAAVLLYASIYLAIDWIQDYRLERQRRIDARLDAKAEQLRATIFRLAEALAEDHAAATQARRNLIRSRYLNTGELPPQK